MKIDPQREMSFHLFEPLSSLLLPNTQLAQLVTESLDDLAHQKPQYKLGNNPSLHADIGCYLSTLVKFLAQHAKKFTPQCPVIKRHRIDCLERDKLIDDSLVNYFKYREKGLKQVGCILDRCLSEIEEVWKNCPQFPLEAETLDNQNVKDSADALEDSETNSEVESQLEYQDNHVSRDIAPKGTQLEITRLGRNSSAVNEHPSEDWSALQRRGKGNYQCPKWKTCKAGGRERNGQPKIFHQNSAYRMHMAKHQRPFKCEIDNCPNRRGFARKDQLRRHQEQFDHNRLSNPLPPSTNAYISSFVLELDN